MTWPVWQQASKNLVYTNTVLPYQSISGVSNGCMVSVWCRGSCDDVISFFPVILPSSVAQIMDASFLNTNTLSLRTPVICPPYGWVEHESLKTFV